MRKLKSLKYTVAAKFVLVIIILSTLLLLFLPMRLKSFFLEQSYNTIEQSQVGRGTPMHHQMNADPRAVNHIFLTEVNGQYTVMSNMRMVERNFIEEAITKIQTQDQDTKRYEYHTGDLSIYYVINKTNESIIISFVYATYVNYYIDSLYHQLLMIIIIVVILSMIIAALFSNSITKPLISISHKIKNLKKENWDDEIEITRQDEIGDIEYALEEMRQHLKTQDRLQREMFQNISHDLKTPIMIIEGYIQSILDGYVNRDEMDDVMHSIMEESQRLEKKVRSLLYINKLDQMSLQHRNLNTIEIKELIHTVINPFKLQFQNIEFNIDIDKSMTVKGDYEQWRVAIENIIENMVRYAKSYIQVTIRKDIIHISNDGKPIEDSLLDKIFIPYGVGNKSNSGLGLAITHKILFMYGYKIEVHNTNQGVDFTIRKH